MAGAWYTTRGRVMRATDIKAAAYASSEIDRCIETASAAVDDLCHRGARERGIPGFAPWKGEITFDWPTSVNRGPWRVWLGRFRLISLSAVTSGGSSIPTASVLLEPYASGPPYNRIELDRASQYSLNYGTGVGQRSLVLDGLWGETDRALTRSGWSLGGSVNDSAVTVTVNAPVDVGHILLVDSERMIVQERAWGTSGQTGTLTASMSAQTLAVSDGTAFFAGEELLLDAERVLVQDVIGNVLVVKRAIAGSTLAAHTGAVIYYSRSFTVERGALGTTAAAHSSGAAVYVWEAPAPVEQLTIAYALDQRAQETSGYARTIGSGENERNASRTSIRELEDRVRFAYGRTARTLAV